MRAGISLPLLSLLTLIAGMECAWLYNDGMYEAACSWCAMVVLTCLFLIGDLYVDMAPSR